MKQRSQCVHVICGVCLALVLWFPIFADARPVSIGVPPWEREANLLTGAHPIGRFVRAGTTDVLVAAAMTASSSAETGSPESPFPYHLSLSDSFSVSDDRRTWKFRLRSSARFLNGRTIEASDAVYSLRRCMAQGVLRGVTEVRGITEEPIPGEVERNVELELSNAPQGKLSDPNSSSSHFLRSISDCPLFEERSSRVFGSDLGVGTNIVSSGRYKITEVIPGRELTLMRVRGERVDEASQVFFRAIDSARHGLTALRTGTLDALYLDMNAEGDNGSSVLAPDTLDVLERARKDQTLVILRCGAEVVLHRKGFHLDCAEIPDLASIGYNNS